MPFCASSADAASSIPLTEFHAIATDTIGATACAAKETDHSSWERIRLHQIKSGQRLCLRRSVAIETGQLPDNPSLFIAMLAAYTVYWDGEALFENGQVGSSRDEEQAAPVKSLIPLSRAQLSDGSHLFAMDLSSFRTDADLNAIAYLVVLTDSYQLYDYRLFISLVSAALIGAMLVLATLFLSLYGIYERDRNYLLFTVLCFSAAVLQGAEQWKLWFDYHYDWHVIRLQLILLLTAISCALLAVFYLNYFGSNHKRRWLTAIAAGQLAAIVLGHGYDGRSEWLFITALLISLAIGIHACIVARRGSTRINALVHAVLLTLGLTALWLKPVMFLEFGFGIVLTLLVFAIWMSLMGHLRRQKDAALKVARVRSELLKRNLQPHYLMNSLTQVQELIETAPPKASAFVEALGAEFRELVQACERDCIGLDEEITLCERHLTIMSMRYRKNYQLLLEGDSNGIQIPSAILHSQIENSFSHNRISGEKPFRLLIKREGTSTELELYTPVEDSIDHEGMGIGENYIRSKLAETCKPGWQLISRAEGDYWLSSYRFDIES